MSNLRSSCELTPENRLKALVEYSGRMEMNPAITTKLYYKSGLNMYKQFLNYYKESSWENAFCLNLKYESLFFDKIRNHPDYAKVPVQVKSINAANFRVIKPKAEHAKRELLKLYKRDYLSYREEMKTVNKGMEFCGPLESTSSKQQKSTTSSFLTHNSNEFRSQVSFNTSRKLERMRKDRKLDSSDVSFKISKTSSLASIPKRTSFEEANNRKASQSSEASGRISKSTQKSVASSIGRRSVKTKTKRTSLMAKKAFSRDSLEAVKK